MNKKLSESLRLIPLFSGLSDQELERLVTVTVFRRYKKGAIIFMEGEPGDAFYFVGKGKIKLYKTMEDGREQILHFVQEGDIFAEILLFDPGHYPATAETVEDCEVGIIPNRDLEEFLGRNWDITLHILKEMSRRLRRAQSQILDLGLKDLCSRLTSTLAGLAGEMGRREAGKGEMVCLRLSQQQLASLVGASRESVSRVLNDLRREGLVTINRQEIIIHDLGRLKEWC
jgi:CRP/FNR family transcriptional regulator